MRYVIAALIALSAFVTGLRAHGAEPTQVIVLTAKLVDGKKTWTPSEVVAHPGEVTFHLVNELPEPHGFQVRGVSDGIVVPPQNSATPTVQRVKLERTPSTYDLICQMHPAHVGSKVRVE